MKRARTAGLSQVAFEAFVGPEFGRCIFKVVAVGQPLPTLFGQWHSDSFRTI
jgi:hypothetical protein